MAPPSLLLSECLCGHFGNGTEGTASEMNLRRGRGIKWVGVVAPPSLLLSELVMELKALHLKGEGNEFEKGEGYKVGGCGGPSFHSTVRVLMWTLR